MITHLGLAEKNPALSVSLTADLQRCLQLQQDGLTEEDFTRFETEAADLVLRQLNVLARPRTLDCSEREREKGGVVKLK